MDFQTERENGVYMVLRLFATALFTLPVIIAEVTPGGDFKGLIILAIADWIAIVIGDYVSTNQSKAVSAYFGLIG